MPQNDLPYLRNTASSLQAQVLYPFTRTVSFLTRVQMFANASEQRWPTRPPLAGFDLPMTSLLDADRTQWLAFFAQMKGRFQTNAAITLGVGGTTYTNLCLMDDVLVVVNARTLQYNQHVKLRQVANGSWTIPTSPGATYPNLACGKVAQMPFTQTSEFLTFVDDNPYGPRYSYQNYGAVTNFPTSYLRSWKIDYPLVTDVDLATLETYFTANQGRVGTFFFTDPIDGITYPNVRYDMDNFTIKYLTKNQNQVSVALQQVNSINGL